MRVRIETIGEAQPEEVVVYCRAVTPEVEALVERLQTPEKSKTNLEFFKGDEQYYLTLDELLFFEIDTERVYAHTVDDSFELKTRLYEIEAILPKYFVRISRAAIVNTRHVRSIQKSLTGVSHIAFRLNGRVNFGEVSIEAL